MARTNAQPRAKRAWALARRQHGIIERWQLLELGFTRDAVAWRLRVGRLHRTAFPGIYSVGRPHLTREGRWLAAARHCGIGAFISHGSAGAYWGLAVETAGIEVSLPGGRSGRDQLVKRHRRKALSSGLIVVKDGVPVASPALTICDLAPRLSQDELEAMISRADARKLVFVKDLHAAAVSLGRMPGASKVRKLIERRTFRLTRSKLERRFLPLMEEAGFPVPQTKRWLNGYEVDFHSPEYGLVFETDGGSFHRTPGQQRRDRQRDHAHMAAGITSVRFTHDQIAYEPGYVLEVLRDVKARLDRRAA